MKKIITRITLWVILSLYIGAIVFIKSDVPQFNDNVAVEAFSNDTLTFAVLGDIHGDSKKLENAIYDLHGIKVALDAVVLNGDTVNRAVKDQYDSINTCLVKNKDLLPKIIIKNIGNHEFYDSNKTLNSPEDVSSYINTYLKFSGEKTVYHDKWIKDYHFISLGSEQGNTEELGSTRAFISNTQQRWLKDKLAENYVPKKPIFVFLHQNISSNAMGWVGVEQLSQLNEILSQYPEVIIFTSHTHLSLEIQNVQSDQAFTIVNVGAIKYIVVPQANGGVKNVEDSQGLYVEVKDNKVVIKGRDFKTQSWIFYKEVP